VLVCWLAGWRFTERQNLTMRMSMRRFTRLTNAFSKKVENHEAAVALHFMHYNSGRIHQALRVTPAMEAGIAGRVWSLEEIVNLCHKLYHYLKHKTFDRTLCSRPC
jgi:hypothetical protein